jgi:ATP-dependent DNA helicase PIF1
MLNDEQRRVFDLIMRGESVFFTGSAGTGKSFLLKEVLKALDIQERKYAVVAPTGVAANNVGGATIHHFFCIGQKNPRKLPSRLKNLSCVVVDEISMVGLKLFDEMIATLDKHNCKPQLVLCGDFLQLPPIKDSYCFLSPNWARIGFKAQLKTIIRQSDSELSALLDRVRFASVTRDDIIFLNSRACESPVEKKLVRLHTHREETARINEYELSMIEGEERIFEATDFGDQNLLKDLQSPPILKLKIGAQVMLVKNIYTSEGLGFYNGETGVVQSFDPLTVLFGNTVHAIKREKNEKVVDKKIAASRDQYPLVLGYAITVHKSQGMTIPNLAVCLEDTFEYGQAYVALSRCTTLEGLYLTKKITRSAIKAHPIALAFMTHLRD